MNQVRIMEVKQNIFADNDKRAAQLRDELKEKGMEQKKNPYENEIFTDQKDFQLAMARVEGK